VLLNDGSVAAVGTNGAGECNVPACPPGLTYVEVTANYFHSAALLSDGTVVDWGAIVGSAPALPPGLSYVQVAAGFHHSIARVSDGSLRAWGDNSFGQCNLPGLPPGLTFITVAAGDSHSLAILSDGSLLAWGYNAFGQCNIPPLPTGVTYTFVSAQEHTLAVRSDGAVIACGWNNYGQCNVPPPPPGLRYVEVAAGYEHSLGRLAPADCNQNGISDGLDLQNGTSSDCNGNGVPDECDIQWATAPDCNANGVIDSCEIASNPSLDLDHNGILDACQNPGTPYCFGDGTGHACPCDPGQIGSPGHGCANATGEGAILSATGSVSVAGDSLQLHIANMPNPSSVLFIQGNVQQGSGLGSFNGDGLLCVNGTPGNLIRLGVHGGQPGTSNYGYGVGSDPLISVRGAIPAIGGTRFYQAWYRDNAAFCTTAHYNFSNGVGVTWIP
jgi:hypothetical protein